MMNKDTKTLYDFIPNYPKGSTKPFIVKSGSKNTFDKISICEKDIIFNLINVYDPEIPVNIYDLGLIYDINISKGNRLTLTKGKSKFAYLISLFLIMGCTSFLRNSFL